MPRQIESNFASEFRLDDIFLGHVDIPLEEQKPGIRGINEVAEKVSRR